VGSTLTTIEYLDDQRDGVLVLDRDIVQGSIVKAHT
jgi:hypothetical protein